MTRQRKRSSRKATSYELIALLVLLGSLPASGWAQQVTASQESLVSIGSRVRLSTTTARAPLTGIVVARDGYGMTLAPEVGPPLRVASASTTYLELSAGRTRHTGLGAWFGALVGVAAGITAGIDPADCDVDSPKFCSRGEAMAVSTIILGGLGALLGRAITTERWVPLTIGAW
jgi:hypothetical protein